MKKSPLRVPPMDTRHPGMMIDMATSSANQGIDVAREHPVLSMTRDYRLQSDALCYNESLRGVTQKAEYFPVRDLRDLGTMNRFVRRQPLRLRILPLGRKARELTSRSG